MIDVIFKTFLLDVPLSVAESTPLADVAARLSLHPSLENYRVFRFIYNGKELPLDSHCLPDYNINRTDTILALLQPKYQAVPKHSIEEYQKNSVTKEKIHEVISNKREELGLSAPESTSAPTITPNALLRTLFGSDDIIGQSLLARIQEVIERTERESNETVDEDVPPEADRENILLQLVPIDDNVIQQLVNDLGFPESRARKALWLHRMDVPSAVDWLVAESEEVQEQPITEEEFRSIKRAYGVRVQTITVDMSRQNASSSPLAPPPLFANAERLESNDDEYMEEGSEEESPSMEPPYNETEQTIADPQLVSMLVDMGFNEDDATSALQNTMNDIMAASYLLTADNQEENSNVGDQRTNAVNLQDVLSVFMSSRTSPSSQNGSSQQQSPNSTSSAN